MYSRDYGGKRYTFEASGGLMHGALVMQDDETLSYWALLTASAIAGPLRGSRLRELPGWRKAKWGDWVKQHPDTQVLSVQGRQNLPYSPYASYFASSDGFRGLKAEDPRLPTKEPIYAFQLDARKLVARPEREDREEHGAGASLASEGGPTRAGSRRTTKARRPRSRGDLRSRPEIQCQRPW